MSGTININCHQFQSFVMIIITIIQDCALETVSKLGTCPICTISVGESDIVPLSRATENANDGTAMDTNDDANVIDTNDVIDINDDATPFNYHHSWGSERFASFYQHKTIINPANNLMLFKSSKINALVNRLQAIFNTDSSTSKVKKCVIFSQWTTMMDLIESNINNIINTNTTLGIVRLDGKMTQKKREQSVRDFNDNDKINIFLVSLKAGGVGIHHHRHYHHYHHYHHHHFYYHCHYYHYH